MSRLLWVKLRRDVATARGRIVLMGGAIAVSLIVFGAALYAGAVVDREFDRNYLDTEPASATLVLTGGVDVDRAAELAAGAADLPGVTDAAVRTQLTTQFAVDGQWSDKPLQLFVAAPDDPRRLARFTVEQGSWPPPPDGVLIERAALTLLGLQVGDPITVAAPGAEPTTFTVTGVAADPSLADARQEQKGYGYVSTDALPLLGSPPLLDQLKITTTDRGSRDAIIPVARDVASWSAASGAAVEQIQVPEPGQQPHRRWIDIILRVLFAFGGTSVLLSGVLMATMLNRLLSRQIPEIGIMKAIGARTAPIMRLHLTATLLLSALATAVAVVPGLLLGRELSRMLLAMNNMSAVSSAVPVWTWLTVVALGLLLAPLMALFPVLRVCRTTVRQAMDHNGVGTAPVAGGAGPVRVVRLLARIPGVDRAVTLGLRNTLRRRTRFALTVVLLAVAGGLFVGGANALAGLYAFRDDAVAQQSWDAEVALAAPTSADTAARTVAALPEVAAVETWTTLPVTVDAEPIGPGTDVEVTATYPDQGHGTRLLAAVPPDTTVLDPPLTAGRWLRPGDTDAVVLNQGAQGGLVPDVRLGDTVRLDIDNRTTTWTVVGLVSQKLAGPSAFVSTEGLAAATGRVGLANRVEITTHNHDPATQAAVADRARQVLTDAGMAVLSANSIGRVGDVVDGHVYLAGYTLLIVAVVIAIAGCIGMASALSSGVLERTREFGVMHAIGAPPAAVRRIVAVEGLVTAIAGLLAAVPLAGAVGIGLSGMVGRMIGGDALPLQVSPIAVGAWVGVVLAGAVLATLPPARRASRLTVREALTYL